MGLVLNNVVYCVKNCDDNNNDIIMCKYSDNKILFLLKI